MYLFRILATDDNGPLFEYVHVIETCTCYRTATCLANFSLINTQCQYIVVDRLYSL